MKIETPILQGRHIRLEPLEARHAAGLLAASAGDDALYEWSLVPRTAAEIARYIETAAAWNKDGRAAAFATVRLSDGVVIGSTRYFELERWAWPPQHALHGRATPDAGEIGYTWLARCAIRSGANTEAKLLMLTHAFETWRMLRVCFHTDMRNQRSRAALERIGGKFEGTLRAHRMAADYTPRDSARYSIVLEEWPEAKRRLEALLARHD